MVSIALAHTPAARPPPGLNYSDRQPFSPKNGANFYSLPMHISHCDTDYYNWRWENYFAAGIRHRIEFEKFAREPGTGIVRSKLSNEIFSKETAVNFVRPLRIELEIRNATQTPFNSFCLHFLSGKLSGQNDFPID